MIDDMSEPPEARFAFLADLIELPAAPARATMDSIRAYSPRARPDPAPVPPGDLAVPELTHGANFDGPWQNVRFASAAAAAARFPDRPWVWSAARDPFWLTAHPDWVVLVDLALESHIWWGSALQLAAPWSAVARPAHHYRRIPAGEHLAFVARGPRLGTGGRSFGDVVDYDAFVLRLPDGTEVEPLTALSGSLVHDVLAGALVAPVDHPAAADAGGASALVGAVSGEVERAWQATAREAMRSLTPLRSRLETILAAVAGLDGPGLRRLSAAFDAAYRRAPGLAYHRAAWAVREALLDAEILALTLLEETATDAVHAIAEREIPDASERERLCWSAPHAVADILAATIAGDRLDAAGRVLLLTPLGSLRAIAQPSGTGGETA